MSDNGSAPADPLLTLIDLGHRARAAASVEELGFLVVNETRRLVHYRQAALWFAGKGVHTLSGVITPDSNAPYVHWLNRVCAELAATGGDARQVVAADLSPEVAAEWTDWLPPVAMWLPLPASAAHAGSEMGGLLLAGDIGLGTDEVALMTEWANIWRHAWLACFRPAPWSAALLKSKARAWLAGDGKWWQRRHVQVGIAVLAALLFPVRLSVLAPGELVPAQPAVIRAPLDGVIGEFHVRPNAAVKAGQVLFSFDAAPLSSRLDAAREALASAEAEYRQFAQLALADAKSKGQLALLLAKIGEKRAEADFIEGQFERSKVTAPMDGIAIFDDPSEWIGRPVQTGERVMRVASPDDVEIEAWLGVGDAIELADAAPVSLYLAVSPFATTAGRVRYIGHDALPRPDGSYAYRVRAAIDAGGASSAGRIGLRGTAKLYGRWVPFGYWAMRRPLATVRQFVAW